MSLKTKLFTLKLLQKWANSGNGHRPSLAKEVLDLREKVKALENKLDIVSADKRQGDNTLALSEAPKCCEATSRYIEEDGVILDTKTGLRWVNEVHYKKTWEEALSLETDNLRLPTYKELKGLIDPRPDHPTCGLPIDRKSREAARFWSSSEYYEGHVLHMWNVSLYTGGGFGDPASWRFSVILIRR